MVSTINVVKPTKPTSPKRKTPPASPHLYLMCGLPYAGKTVLGRALAEYVNGVYLGFDAVWLELAARGGDVTTARVEQHLKGQLGEAAERQQAAVYDTLHGTRMWRDASAQLAAALGFRPLLVYLATPAALVYQRYAANARTAQRHQIALSTLTAEIAKFEAPAAPERFIVYRPDTTLATFLATVPQ